MNKVAVVLNFHNEGNLAIPSIKNIYDSISRARTILNNCKIDFIACCDTLTAATDKIVDQFSNLFDEILKFDVSDLGASRNMVVLGTDYDFLTFHDADDLVSLDYFEKVIPLATQESETNSIWHPEFAYFFDENDFNSSLIKSEFLQMTSSDTKYDNLLIFMNLYTSNAFTTKGNYLKFPYINLDRVAQIGVEDWDWNRRTTFAGIPHRIVPDTVHCIRIKKDSLSKSNTRFKYLPPSIFRNLIN